MQNSQEKNEKTVESLDSESLPKKPDDRGSVQIDAHIKIYDPNTNQTYVEGRA